MDNVMLGRPHRHYLIGQNVNEFKDEKGSPLFQEFKKVSEDGGKGWVKKVNLPRSVSLIGCPVRTFT